MKEFCTIFFIAVVVFSIIQILSLLEQRRMNNEQIRVLNSSIQLNLPEIVATFETFIDLVMNRYLALNRNFKEADYINSEEEELLLREISTEVMETISPHLVNKLGLIYNIASDDDLANIITKTVYLKLLDYISSNNEIKNK